MNHSTRPYQPACLICGKIDSQELEFHSIGGARIVLCRKCLRRLRERRRVRPAPIWDPPDELEVIGRALLGQADLLAILAQEHWKFGHMLIERVRREAPWEDGSSPADQEPTPMPPAWENSK